MGGGFIYTNLEIISIGIVITIDAAQAKKPQVELHSLIDEFKERPEVAPLIAGGKLAEYAAHAIPEGGFKSMGEIISDGLILVGDAAGFCLNLGITVRGMEYALVSGMHAAETIKYAKEKGDFSKATLRKYDELLRNSFVMKDMETFQYAPQVLANPRIFETYPQAASEILENLAFLRQLQVQIQPQ